MGMCRYIDQKKMYYIIYIYAHVILSFSHTHLTNHFYSHTFKNHSLKSLHVGSLLSTYAHFFNTRPPPPQKVGVYHQGSIRLVKCSSNYSQRFINSNLYDPVTIRNLRNNVRLGIWFHFAKFYILLMPFYCGVQASTIPVSYIIGLFCGFVLMWVVFCE